MARSEDLDTNNAGSLEEIGMYLTVLKDAIAIPIKTLDERLTTVQAQRFLIQGNVRREKRKEKVDKTAAAILLQSYLDNFAERL